MCSNADQLLNKGRTTTTPVRWGTRLAYGGVCVCACPANPQNLSFCVRKGFSRKPDELFSSLSFSRAHFTNPFHFLDFWSFISATHLPLLLLLFPFRLCRGPAESCSFLHAGDGLGFTFIWRARAFRWFYCFWTSNFRSVLCGGGGVLCVTFMFD